VVAGEVRTLAQRSATAAREIKSLIGESVAKSRSGASLAETAGGRMQDVLASVRRVTELMGEISTAAVEQSSGIEQVNQTVTQLDEGTQQNAALVEEASAAARSLEEQAIQLQRSVRRFRL
jgi:methyl-accepting chemotaxis protein